MTRIERKNRQDINFKGCGRLNNVFDDAVKDIWRINDAEYDFLCLMPEEILDFLISENNKYSHNKKAIRTIDKILEYYYDENTFEVNDELTDFSELNSKITKRELNIVNFVKENLNNIINGTI